VTPTPPGFTPEELTNIAVFGTDAARARYAVSGLTPREEALVRRYFAAGARVVDLGCGYGRTTVPLARLGYRVVGVDVVPRMLEEARRTHPEIAWVLASATDLGFRDGSVDHVLFSANGLDCIHPLDRRDAALAEIRRVLRPGGSVVYSAHNWLAQVATSVRQPSRRAIVAANARAGRLGPGYLRVPQAGATLTMYFGTPRAETRRLRRLGFRDVTVHGGKIGPRLARLGRLGTLLFDVWPHYVAHR
jgi:SAM-dependent methyltransferase